MGDPKKHKKKYSKPTHMWQKVRIDAERELVNQYGLSNKKEIWKASSLLTNYTKQAKRLIALKNLQSENESSQLLEKLLALGLIKNKTLESVLDITLKDVLERRLQTVVFKKELARSIKQSRQMIVMAHISVADKKITAPSYLVKVGEEQSVGFTAKSPFSNADHPERVIQKAKVPGGPQ